MKQFAVAVALIVLVGLSVSAHHSGANYFEDQRLEQKDVVVVSYTLVNPHGRLVYVVTDNAGNKTEWTGELQSANYSRRMGWNESTFEAGQKLSSVVGAPSRTGAPFMRLERVVWAIGDTAVLRGEGRGIKRAGAT
jgi:hypothetical protein